MNASSSTATTIPTTIHLVLVTVGLLPLAFVSMSLLRDIADQFERRDSESRTPSRKPGVTTPFVTTTRLIGTFNYANKKASGGESDPTKNPRANRKRP